MGLALGFAAGVLLLPFLLAWGFIHPPRRHHSRSPRTAHDAVFERVRLRAGDGMRLSGWYVPPPSDMPTRGAAIICHGYWGHRGMMLPHLGFLHRAGYAVLLFDFRGHGWSHGLRVSFGNRETLDLIAAVDWIKARPETRALPLAVVAESMGAVTTILVAAVDPRIEAVVADSAFARFDGAIETRMASLFGKPLAATLAPHSQRVGERILNKPATELAPVEVIRAISPRPILLIQGSDDEVVPPHSLELLSTAANPGTTQVWQIPGARHVRGVHTHADEYERRLITFLDGALPPAPGDDAARGEVV